MYVEREERTTVLGKGEREACSHCREAGGGGDVKRWGGGRGGGIYDFWGQGGGGV